MDILLPLTTNQDLAVPFYKSINLNMVFNANTDAKTSRLNFIIFQP